MGQALLRRVDVMRGMWDVGLGSAATTADLSLQDVGAQPSWGRVHWPPDDLEPPVEPGPR